VWHEYFGYTGTLPDAIFLSQRSSARRISAPACAVIGVPHDSHSRLAEFSSARFRLQYPPRQPTERFGFSIPTVAELGGAARGKRAIESAARSVVDAWAGPLIS
jgi:hypothetical protein